MLQDVQALGVRGHDPVLDAVVDHLHEVAGAVGPAVEIALLRLARVTGAAGRAHRGVDAGRDRLEDRIEMADDVVFAADHEAEPAVETEHATARAAVDVVDAARLEPRGAIDVVAVVRVATVDDDVALVEVREQLVDRGVDERRPAP